MGKSMWKKKGDKRLVVATDFLSKKSLGDTISLEVDLGICLEAVFAQQTHCSYLAQFVSSGT